MHLFSLYGWISPAKQILDIQFDLKFTKLNGPTNRWLSIGFFLVLQFFGAAQNPQLDSFRNLIKVLPEDTNKVKELIAFSRLIQPYSIQSAKDSSELAFNLSKSLDYENGLINAKYNMGWYRLELGEKEAGLVDGFEALRYLHNKKDSLRLVGVYQLIGRAYLLGGQADSAIYYQFLAADISEKNGYTEMAGNSYSNVGEIYHYANDLEKSYEYYKIALGFFEELEDSNRLAYIYTNLGSVGADPYDCMDYLQKAIDIQESKGDLRAQAYSYSSLGAMQRQAGMDLKVYLESFRKALNFGTATSIPEIITYNQIELGNVFTELNLLDSAEWYYLKALQSNLNANNPDRFQEAAHELAYLYFRKNRFKDAFEWVDSAFHVYQNIYRQDLSEITSEANAKYEAQKREAEIARQNLIIEKQQNSRKIIVGGSILSIGLLAALFFGVYQRAKRKRRESEMALAMEKQRRLDMEELNRVKGDFFNNVSHELKTPLTLIWGPLKEALNSVRHVKLKENLEIALRNSQRLLTLTNEILDLSRLEAGKLLKEESEVSLKSFLHRVMYSFGSLAESRQIALQIDVDIPEDLGVRTDVDKLEKILNNLISNSIKYSDEGGKVSLHLDSGRLIDESKLSIAIEDDGRGIAPEELPHIFDRYFQSKSISQSSGTGIGLSLVRELCQFLGGEVDVKSELDKGSIFSVTLPVTLIHAFEGPSGGILEHAAESRDVPDWIGLRKPRLLIVEDDLDMVRYLKNIFNNEYECRVAYNGKQAMEILKKSEVDLISSDVMMPEMDGFSFREEVNRMNKFGDVPFILLTARSLEEDKVRGLQLGVDDYITKPFSVEEMKARVRNLLRNKANRQNSLKEDGEVMDVGSRFIESAREIVEAEIDNPEFRVSVLAGRLNYSERQLARLVKRMTGLTPVEFILEIRLQSAYQLLKTRRYSTVSEVRYEVGIESASYFTSRFQERFGIKPSEVMA